MNEVNMLNKLAEASKRKAYKKFEDELLRNLKRSCYNSRACKNLGREHIILCDGKRVALNNKEIWSTKKYAEKAIKRYIIDGKLWWLDAKRMWISTTLISHFPKDAEEFANNMRKEWAEKHLTTMPLRDYMVFEHKRAGNE